MCWPCFSLYLWHCHEKNSSASLAGPSLAQLACKWVGAAKIIRTTSWTAKIGQDRDIWDEYMLLLYIPEILWLLGRMAASKADQQRDLWWKRPQGEFSFRGLAFLLCKVKTFPCHLHKCDWSPVGADPRPHTRTPVRPLLGYGAHMQNTCFCLKLWSGNHAFWLLEAYERLGRNLSSQWSSKRIMSECHHWQMFCILRQNLKGLIKLPAPHTHTYREVCLGFRHLFPFSCTTRKGIKTALRLTVQTVKESHPPSSQKTHG